MALGSTQPLTEMSTGSIFCGVKAAIGARCSVILMLKYDGFCFRKGYGDCCEHGNEHGAKIGFSGNFGFPVPVSFHHLCITDAIYKLSC